MEQILKEIIEGVADTYGNKFFSVIIQQLDKVIQSDYTFIGQFDQCNNSCKTIALVSNGQLIDNFEYHLEGTPCKDVSDSSICLYPDKILEYYPDDQLLIDMEVRGYIGTPLQDSHGKVMGIIVALYKKPIKDQKLTLTLFQLFSSRISGEFERLDKEKQLLELNDTLDLRIKERTAELERTVKQLTLTQEQLVETEKMAVLGDLIAGVAHEVNTPLGVAITAESLLGEEFETFQAKFDAEKVSLSDMKHFLKQHEQCLPMISRNLYRAKEIIDNFKRMATEQNEFTPEPIYLNQYYQRLIYTLTPLLKRKSAHIEFLACDQDFVTTYPGCHVQILTNLVSNSIEHGFVDRGDNIIKIKINAVDDRFVIDYFDNGVGINEKNKHKIFDPFFTTTRNKGNCGLGLSIIYNLINTYFKGTLLSLPCEQGVHFQYEFTSC